MKAVQFFRVLVFISILCGFSTFAIGQQICPLSTATISLLPTSLSFTSKVGAGTFGVTITSSCGYKATTQQNWIHPAPVGLSLQFGVDANPDICSRSGSIKATITDQFQNTGASAFGAVSQLGVGGDFSLFLSPSSQSLFQSHSVSYTVNVNRTAPFNGPVGNFSVSGLPSGVTASFSNFTSTSATLTLTATRTATTGSFSITVTAINSCIQRTSPPATLTVLPRSWNAADVTVFTGAPVVASGTHLGGHINTIATNPNVDELFNFDTNLHMDSPWWNWSWHVTDLSGLLQAPAPAAGSAITDHVNTIANDDEAFYFDTNQHLDSFWWDGINWHISDVTAAAGAPVADAGSALTGHINTGANVDEVFYFCAGGHLCGPWWESATWQWHSADITVLAGCCAPAMQGSALSSHFDSVGNDDEVFYQIPDQRIISNWWDGTWHATDVTTAAGAAVAAAGTPLASHVNTVANSDEVYYIGNDGHLDELWWQPYQWHVSDITLATGAPLPAAGSQIASFMNTLDGFDEVFYEGADQHIYLLWWDGSNWTWHFSDLTVAGSGPLAAVGSPLNSHFNTIANTEEVYYIGTDQHIHELWR